jgi:hypothetical protein
MANNLLSSDFSFTGSVDFSNATGIALPSSIITNANLTASPNITRAKLVQESKSYTLPMENWRVFDAFNTVLPGTSADDDLALIGGTFGTNTPMIKSRDLKTLSTSLRARTTFTIPAEYDAAQSLIIRAKAGMQTTVSDGTCVIDFEIYKSDNEGGLGSDLCATAAQSINSLTFANKDFTVTSTGLAAGDVLDIRMTVTVVDTATATTVTAAIGVVQAIAAVRG